MKWEQSEIQPIYKSDLVFVLIENDKAIAMRDIRSDGSRFVVAAVRIIYIFELLLGTSSRILHVFEWFMNRFDLRLEFTRNRRCTFHSEAAGCSQFVVYSVVEFRAFVVHYFSSLFRAHDVRIRCSIISGRWSCQHKFHGLSLKMQPQKPECGHIKFN